MTTASILGSVLLGIGLMLIGPLLTYDPVRTAAHCGGRMSVTVADLQRRLAAERGSLR
ncbi:hypothetical protein [Nocardia sp. JMUB6875]|uniref:hypothetical protein n=1 Tax=Nocardia sp. JMUB6875 TaxID=3158170 RepID=UPI0034E85DC3